eukprot:7770887-Pyramimonas_sp.AAC.1
MWVRSRTWRSTATTPQARPSIPRCQMQWRARCASSWRGSAARSENLRGRTGRCWTSALSVSS